MNKRRYTITISIILIVLVSLIFWFLQKRHYPNIAEDAQLIKFVDITKNNPGNRIDDGIEITYIHGHTDSSVRIMFDDCKPYKRLEMYESEGVFIIIYDEAESGESIDRILSVKGFAGFKTSSDGQRYEYKVEVYKNGKRVRDVKIGDAQE